MKTSWPCSISSTKIYFANLILVSKVSIKNNPLSILKASMSLIFMYCFMRNVRRILYLWICCLFFYWYMSMSFTWTFWNMSMQVCFYTRAIILANVILSRSVLSHIYLILLLSKDSFWIRVIISIKLSEQFSGFFFN